MPFCVDVWAHINLSAVWPKLFFAYQRQVTGFDHSRILHHHTTTQIKPPRSGNAFVASDDSFVLKLSIFLISNLDFSLLFSLPFHFISVLLPAMSLSHHKQSFYEKMHCLFSKSFFQVSVTPHLVLSISLLGKSSLLSCRKCQATTRGSSQFGYSIPSLVFNV